jgi:hypothetical protein
VTFSAAEVAEILPAASVCSGKAGRPHIFAI